MVVGCCWTLYKPEKGECWINIPFPGHVCSSYPTGRKGGESHVSLWAAASLPALQATAVISWLWWEAVLVRTTGTMPRGLPAILRHEAARKCTGDEWKRQKRREKSQVPEAFNRDASSLPEGKVIPERRQCCKNHRQQKGKSASGCPGRLRRISAAFPLCSGGCPSTTEDCIWMHDINTAFKMLFSPQHCSWFGTEWGSQMKAVCSKTLIAWKAGGEGVRLLRTNYFGRVEAGYEKSSRSRLPGSLRDGQTPNP